jgi:hypothetical protein
MLSMSRIIFFIACFCFSVQSQAAVTRNFAIASYETMTGVCVITSSKMKLSLIRGYLINPDGYVLGRLERLDDFHHVLQKQVETKINNGTIYSSSPIALNSFPESATKVTFTYAVSAVAFFDCDFSEQPI